MTNLLQFAGWMYSNQHLKCCTSLRNVMHFINLLFCQGRYKSCLKHIIISLSMQCVTEFWSCLLSKCPPICYNDKNLINDPERTIRIMTTSLQYLNGRRSNLVLVGQSNSDRMGHRRSTCHLPLKKKIYHCKYYNTHWYYVHLIKTTSYAYSYTIIVLFI